MPSLRRAIDAKCKSCIYDPRSGGGTWRQQVAACTSSNCPLHPVRPETEAKRTRRERDVLEGQEHARTHVRHAPGPGITANSADTTGSTACGQMTPRLGLRPR